MLGENGMGLDVKEITKIDGIVKFLEAYSFLDVRMALKEISLRRRGEAIIANEQYKWTPWRSDDPPPKGFEWRKINGEIQIRPPIQFPSKRRPKKPQVVPKILREDKMIKCPICANVAFKQDICPKCLKSKAGIKAQWICGECNFTFFTD